MGSTVCFHGVAFSVVEVEVEVVAEPKGDHHCLIVLFGGERERERERETVVLLVLLYNLILAKGLV